MATILEPPVPTTAPPLPVPTPEPVERHRFQTPVVHEVLLAPSAQQLDGTTW